VVHLTIVFFQESKHERMEETSIGHCPCARWRHETAHLATRSMLALLTMPPVTAHMKAKAIPSRRWFWQREAQGTRGRLGRDWELQVLCARAEIKVDGKIERQKGQLGTRTSAAYSALGQLKDQ
jgi:hypothetical protein